MKEKIVANDRKYLKTLVDKEINQCGNECNLNHIDISKIKDLSGLFEGSEFNGDISKWNVSNVTTMFYLFCDSKFNGDVSNWKPLRIKNTINMFENCSALIPYWFGDSNNEVVRKIKSYDLFNKMNDELVEKEPMIKKMKI